MDMDQTDETMLLAETVDARLDLPDVTQPMTFLKKYEKSSS
jgi:hypothetical protein